GGSGSNWRWSNIYLKSEPNVSSDSRLKEDIRDNELGLDFIKKLRTATFRMKDEEDNRIQYGVIAQQLLDALRSSKVDVNDINMVTASEDGMFAVRKGQLITPVIKAIQELLERVEALENAG